MVSIPQHDWPAVWGAEKLLEARDSPRQPDIGAAAGSWTRVGRSRKSGDRGTVALLPVLCPSYSSWELRPPGGDQLETARGWISNPDQRITSRALTPSFAASPGFAHACKEQAGRSLAP